MVRCIEPGEQSECYGKQLIRVAQLGFRIAVDLQKQDDIIIEQDKFNQRQLLTTIDLP